MSALSTPLGPRDPSPAIDRMPFDDQGHGYDRFGARRESVRRALALTRPLYDWYFRVQSHGAEHIPARGPAIMVANHSGTLPWDAAMLYVDVLRQTDPPRLPRPVADLFVPALPFVSTFFARAGVVAGTRRNAHALLEQGELLQIFPEGTGGISKPFSQRYRLQTWTEGHAELALRHRAPVIPVAIIGAEEQMPMLHKVRGFHWFGAPYLPIPATLLPLPVRYHIYYGKPLCLHAGRRRADADDPDVVREAALVVKRAVQHLVDSGRARRKGIFR